MLKSNAEIEDIMAYVYVVEDDKNISEIESFALKNAGHTVVECASGKEFHKLMRDRIPDMILLDVMLPDEDGLEILRKIRQTPETRRVPVIMVTAKTTELDKVKGLDLGADDYITKPFGIMELISRVKALLRRTGSSDEEKLMLYGAYGGTPLYLQQINEKESFEENIKRAYLKVTSYLYEEALLLLRQEVQEPGVYSAIIEAIASGYTKANEISTKIGEDSAKCLKYIKTLCELGILHKETPFGEKESSRKTIYGISDFMFRFWYRYVFANRTLIETGAQQAVWEKRIKPDYYSYMGLVFEKVCMDYLNAKNAKGELPILYTSIGRWWGTNAATHGQEEIDLIANDGKDYLFGECKWRNEKLDISVLKDLKAKADVFSMNRKNSYYVLFSKSGFTEAVLNEVRSDDSILLVDLAELMKF